MRPLIAALLLAGCTHTSPQAPPETPPPAVRVVTEAARVESLKPLLKLSGQVVPTEQGTVVITAPLEGVVTEPLVKTGSAVNAEQPVARMNNVYGKTSLEVLDKLENVQSDLVQAQARLSEARTRVTEGRVAQGQAQSEIADVQNELAQADAELTFAQADLDRKKLLWEGGVFSKSDYDAALERQRKALSAHKTAQTEVAIKRRNLPLAQKNVQQLEAAVGLAEEAVKIAQANFERSKAVLGQANLVGASLPQDLTSLNLNSGHSREAAERASSFVVRSPITGVVAEVSMTAGLKVPSGAVLAKVVDLRQVYVDANAFEADIAQLREGDRLEVTSKTAPGRIFPGRVTYLGRTVDPQTRSIAVRSLLANPGGSLRPGTFVDVSISLPERERAVTVPAKAVIRLGQDEFVLVETGPGRFEKKLVEAGPPVNGRVEITKGLRAGDKVVTEGNLLLESRE